LSGRKIKAEQNKSSAAALTGRAEHLWQSDLNMALSPTQKPNHKLRTYLSRSSMTPPIGSPCRVYDSQKLPVLEDTFRKAVINADTDNRIR